MQTQTHQDFEQQQQYGAMIRSLSGEASAQIRDWQLFHQSAPLDSIAPHLNLENLKTSWAFPRGILDGIALRLRYSDADIHASLTPEGMIESLIFEVLEQIRVESNCPDELKGSQQNVQTQFIAWMQQFIASGGVEGSIGLLLITIFSTVWMKLNSQPIPQLMQDIVEATRAGLAEGLGPHLVKLKANQLNQAKYANASLEIAQFVSRLIEDEYQNVSSIHTKQKNIRNSFLKIEWAQPPTQSGSSKQHQHHSVQESKKSLERALDQYIVFNADYDIEIEAKKRIRPAQLAIYQQQLNEEISKLNIPWGKLSRSYQNIFLSTTNGSLHSAV